MTTIHSNRCTEDVQRLIEMGFYVFPMHHPRAYMVCSCKLGSKCENIAKHPCVAWKADASADAEWAGLQAKRFPGCNWGISCGPSQLVVIDEDEFDEFSRFCADMDQELPQTFQVRTGRGIHYYFRVAEGQRHLTNSEGSLARYKVNVRGFGGYVVAPGSVHRSGDIYSADDWSTPIAELPTWLYEALSIAAESELILTAAQRKLAGLVRYVLSATPGKDRNNRLNWAAWTARKHIASGTLLPRNVVGALLAAAEHVGISQHEAVATIKSGLYGGAMTGRPAK